MASYFFEIVSEDRRSSLTYRQTIEKKNEALWKALSRIPIVEAVREWLETIPNPCTKNSYSSSMKELFLRGFLNSSWNLQVFQIFPANQIIDKIKRETIYIQDKKGKNTSKTWSNRTKEARISCFISFTRYLSRRTEGMVLKATPKRLGMDRTFSPHTKKVKTEAMTRSQLFRFLEKLGQINHRDALIAKLCLHGAKRINEVLTLEIKKIDFFKKQISFSQFKSHLLEDFTVISFNRGGALVLFEELKKYLKDRETGLVFITRNGKKIQKSQIDRNFAKAGKRAEIPFRVSPHHLRTTAITLWKEDGFSDSLIMKASGHSSCEMIRRYDKTDAANNVTRISSIL